MICLQVSEMGTFEGVVGIAWWDQTGGGVSRWCDKKDGHLK